MYLGNYNLFSSALSYRHSVKGSNQYSEITGTIISAALKLYSSYIDQYLLAEFSWIGWIRLVLLSIHDVINEGGSANDIASGTNPVVGDYDGKDDIFPRLGSDIRQQLLALPPYYWHASRCISAKDIQYPATQEEKLNWDNDLLTDSNKAADFEDPER